jgi:hypothetical protein
MQAVLSDKDRRIIVLFAAVGFVVTTVAGICMSLQAPNIITNLMILFSPGLWLLLPRVYGTVGIANSTVAWWFSIGVVAIANCLLYALVGAVIVGLGLIVKRKRSTT